MLSLGCSSDSAKTPVWPDPVPVSGTVTYGDQPLADAMVTFSPTGTTAGQGAAGLTDNSGKYVLQAPWTDGKTRPGAIPGTYKVSISRMVKADGSVWKPDPKSPDAGPMSIGAREEMPEQYSFQSKLTADVSKDNGVFDFKLEKAQ
jgi:hypothetical protein